MLMSAKQIGQPLPIRPRWLIHASQNRCRPYGTSARRGSRCATRHTSQLSVSLASVALTVAAPASALAWSSSGESLSEPVASVYRSHLCAPMRWLTAFRNSSLVYTLSAELDRDWVAALSCLLYAVVPHWRQLHYEARPKNTIAKISNFVKIGKTVAEISRFLWFFKMAAAMLDFHKFKILTVDPVPGPNMSHLAKFHQDRSNGRR